MKADGGNVEESLVDGAMVEGLDIGEGVDEFEAGDTDFAGGEAVEHEGVVGIGTVGDLDLSCGTHVLLSFRKRVRAERKARPTG